MDNILQMIREKLETAFAPQHLEVRDVSESHRGHAGYRDGGQSHFEVDMISDKLTGQTRIAQHRAVHQALGAELVGRIHALALNVRGE